MFYYLDVIYNPSSNYLSFQMKKNGFQTNKPINYWHLKERNGKQTIINYVS